jgi:hypothetical protein
MFVARKDDLDRKCEVAVLDLPFATKKVRDPLGEAMSMLRWEEIVRVSSQTVYLSVIHLQSPSST